MIYFVLVCRLTIITLKYFEYNHEHLLHKGINHDIKHRMDSHYLKI